MNEFLKEMSNVSLRAQTSIERSCDALKLIDTDFKKFLLQFFYEDVRKNLFLTQIFYEGNDSLYNFQQYIFERACAYFRDMLRIDGVSFYFDARVPLSQIDIVISETKVASINIFFKELILFENVFFEQIDNGIMQKEKERDVLQMEYDKCLSNLNSYSVFSREDDDKMINSVLNSTVFKKNTKKKRITKIDELNYNILKLEDEISELLITRQLLVKNLSNIKYFQEKISSRISSNLNYKITIE